MSLLSAWRRDRASAIAVLALALAPCLYFWRGALGQVLLSPNDGLTYSFPLRLLAAQMVMRGEWPWWNTFAFSGFPLFAEMQTAVLYPGSWFFYVLPPIAAMNAQMLITYSIAAVGTFAFTRAIGCTRFAAAFAGLTFAMGGFMVAHLSHVATPQGGAWLPWLLWGVERLRHAPRFRYVLIGALAVALGFLAGHPPIPVYLLMVAGLYVLVFAVIDAPAVGRVRYLGLCAAAVAVGLAITAVQMLPAGELAAQSVRAQLTFVEFASYSLPRLQLPLLLFPYFFGGSTGNPYWGAWNLAELTGYVGAAPLMLAVASLAQLRSNRQVAFWAGLAAFSFVLVLGDGTPFARVMFQVPLYNLFRAQARNLLEFDFAIAVLSALALSTWRPRALRRSALLVAAVAVVFSAAAVFAGQDIWDYFVSMRFNPELGRQLLADATTFSSPGILVALAFIAAAAAALLVLAWSPHPAVWGALLAVQAIDLFVFNTMMGQPTPARELVFAQPYSAQAAAAALATTPGRLVHLNATAGPVDYRWALWGVRMIGGYDPFMLSRYGEFAGGMPYWGQLTARAIVQRPLFVDLLGGRFLLLDHGLSLTPEKLMGLAMVLPPGESVDLKPLQPQGATAVEVVCYLADGMLIEQGAPVARLSVTDVAGKTEEFVLRAGEHTSEWAIDTPTVGGRARHQRAVIAHGMPGTPFGGYTYRSVFDLPEARQVARIRVQYLDSRGVLSLQRIALGSRAADTWTPLSVVDALRAQPDRWQVRQDTPAYTLVENRRAMPRAWLVGETAVLPGAAILRAVQTQRLPDGRAFDPAALALLEEGEGRDRGAVDPAARVAVIEDSANAMELTVDSGSPAFLVLGDIYYPGWKATIDGRAEPIVRTNYVMRGLEVPAGSHRVRIELRPGSVYRGAAISAATILLLAVIGAWRVAGRRSTAPRPG